MLDAEVGHCLVSPQELFALVKIHKNFYSILESVLSVVSECWKKS